MSPGDSLQPARGQAPVDDERIDLRSGPSMERWTRELSVSREQLAAVVAIVGDRAREVADYLKREGPPATPE